MNWNDVVFAIAVYFIIWWVTLFLVLPFGVKTQADENEIIMGTEHSAPAQFKIKKLIAINTVVSLCIFGACYLIIFWFDFGLDYIPWIGPPID